MITFKCGWIPGFVQTYSLTTGCSIKDFLATTEGKKLALSTRGDQIEELRIEGDVVLEDTIIKDGDLLLLSDRKVRS